MADVELIIKISEESYNNLKIGCTQRVSNGEMIEAIKNGKPLTPDVLADLLMEERIRGELDSYTYWQMKGEQLDKQQAAKWITNKYTDDITCPFCREVLKRNYFNNYCSNCGNKVESEDEE